MESFFSKRIGELLAENKKLYNLNIKNQEEIYESNNIILDCKTQIASLKSENEKFQQTTKKLQNKNKLLEKKSKKHFLILKNECKRKDVLNNKLIGSRKDIREIELKNELNKEYNRNMILMTLVQELFSVANEDFTVFYNTLQVIDDCKDDTIKVFVEGLKNKITETSL